MQFSGFATVNSSPNRQKPWNFSRMILRAKVEIYIPELGVRILRKHHWYFCIMNENELLDNCY